MTIGLKENLMKTLHAQYIFYEEMLIRTERKLACLDENSPLRWSLVRKSVELDEKGIKSKKLLNALNSVDLHHAHWEVFLKPLSRERGDPVHVSLKEGSLRKAIRLAERTFKGKERAYSESIMELVLEGDRLEIPEEFYSKHRTSRAPSGYLSQ